MYWSQILRSSSMYAFWTVNISSSVGLSFCVTEIGRPMTETIGCRYGMSPTL